MADLMSQTQVLVSKLQDLIEKFQAKLPDTSTVAAMFGKNAGPSIGSHDIVGLVAETIETLLENRSHFDSDGCSTMIGALTARADFLVNQTLPMLAPNSQSAGAAGIAMYVSVDAMRRAVRKALPQAESSVELAKRSRRMASSIRAIESRLSDVSLRTKSLDEMVGRIEDAHDAADQLPADLDSLKEARGKIIKLHEDSLKEATLLNSLVEKSVDKGKVLDNVSIQAEQVLKKCESAYRTATSVGLAAAFTERATALERAAIFWVVGLIAALITAAWFGAGQLRETAQMIASGNSSGGSLAFSLVSSVLSLGAPIWFAWLATKQTGQNFRLAEDYAFKASVSRAYEGYRNEAARIDEALEAQLLASALSRLDELPLRLVDPVSHSSPWAELMQSAPVKDAMKTVPSFVEMVRDLAKEHISKKPGRTQRTQERSDGQGSPHAE